MARTEEQKREWKEKMQGLSKMIRSMPDSQREKIAAKMPIVTCEGHALSLYNQCFLGMQAARALTVVGGFKQWQRQGAKVIKGEHSCGYIYVPTGKKGQGENEADEADEVRFVLVPMFDVSQTEQIH